jgi:HlyD family secretion protein
MKNFINKIKLYAVKHKIISTVILIVIILVGYFGYHKLTSTSGDTRYITAKVSKGTIIASVSGTGQVSDVNQVDLKPKASGDVVYIGVQNGQKVGAGALLVQLDTKDAQKTVRDAQTNLDSANLSLTKIKIQDSETNMNSTLSKTYDDGFSAVTNTFYDLNSILTGLDAMLATNNLSDNAARTDSNIAKADRDNALNAYYAAKTAFDKNNTDYRLLNNNSPKADIENIIKETYDTTKLLGNAIKSASDFVDFMARGSSNASAFTSYQTTLSTYITTTNGHLSALLAATTNINNNKDSSQNNSLDIQSAQLSVQQKENTLQDAKDNLSDYSVRTPFAGTITNFNIKKSDSVTPITVVGTLITTEQLALVSLNEVDVAKIKIGQKATLTFDAIPDLTISGVVSEIDSIGTVAQGVVTYNIKINFDTQDERVKPGMSVSAAIITDIKQNVLAVPNSAIKSSNGQSYVESFGYQLPAPTDGLLGSISKTAPSKIPVEVGLSNDSETEITSGINEGDEIVTRTILPSATAPAAAAPSLFGSGGGARPAAGGGFGGGARTPAR